MVHGLGVELAQMGLVVDLSLSTINTNTASLPKDLQDPSNPEKLRKDLTWDSKEVVERYKAMLQAILPAMSPAVVAHLSVGNEIDATLGGAPKEESDAYVSFMTQVAPVARALLPNTSVGNTFEFSRLASLQPYPKWVEDIFSLSDGIPLTYYPLTGDFQVEDPSKAPAADIPAMLDLLPKEKCLWIQELGYPSGNGSIYTNSTQEKQAEFFTTAASTLRSLNQTTNRISGASVFKFVDWTQQICQYFETVYGIHDPNFLVYLCSLGVIDSQGNPKDALHPTLELIECLTQNKCK